MIKDTPIKIADYYKSFISKYSEIKDNNLKKIERNVTAINEYDTAIQKNPIVSNGTITFNPNNYKEFVEKRYSNGKFNGTISRLYNIDGFRTSETFIFSAMVAKLLEDNAALIRSNDFCNKCLSVTYKQYRVFLLTFANQIMKEVILNANGYDFGYNIGWICINRVKRNKRGRPLLDYAKTKENKKRLLAEGKRLYNKKEADWCEENGIEYNATDYRIYRNDEYLYEIPLLDCKCKGGNQLDFTITDYRGKGTRNKTNKELIAESNGNKEWICELTGDIKLKLHLCNDVDKTNYLKYIRNEDQTSSADWQTYRKDR